VVCFQNDYIRQLTHGKSIVGAHVLDLLAKAPDMLIAATVYNAIFPLISCH